MCERDPDVPNVRIDVTTVRAPGPYWHDEFGLVHAMQPTKPNHTMCHKMTCVIMLHDWQIEGYTEETPTCLLCVVIER